MLQPGQRPAPRDEHDGPRDGEPWGSWMPSDWQWPYGIGWPRPLQPSCPRRCGIAHANTFPWVDAFAGGSWPLGDGGDDGGDLQVLNQGKGRVRRDARRCPPQLRLLRRARRPVRQPHLSQGTYASDDVDPNERPESTWHPVGEGNREPRRSLRAVDHADDETQDMPLG